MRSLILLAILAASPAEAECPTQAALAAGESAFVAYPDGAVVEMKWLGAGMIQETTRYAGGIGDFRMISMGGVFITDEVDIDGDAERSASRITTRYPDDLFQRMPVAPHQSFTLRAVNSFADETEPEEEYIEVRTGAQDEVDIAGCRYAGFPLLMTYSWGTEEFTSMMTHLPELGLSLELARMDKGQPPDPFAPLYFGLEAP
jgi:hypothetical protein